MVYKSFISWFESKWKLSFANIVIVLGAIKLSYFAESSSFWLPCYWNSSSLVQFAIIIGSGKDLAQNRRQAITCIDDDVAPHFI